MDRITQIKSYLEANPADNFLQHALALEFIKIGDDAGARSLFEQLLERDPSYIGSYYHLAKLLERTGEIPLALDCYQRGMQQALAGGDRHALNELRAAFEEISE